MNKDLIIAKQKELIVLLKVEPRFKEQTDKHYTWEESVRELESELQALESEAEPKPAKELYVPKIRECQFCKFYIQRNDYFGICEKMGLQTFAPDGCKEFERISVGPLK